MDDFRFPDLVSDLSEVPADCHCMYEPTGDGYSLKAEERQGRDEFLATIDKLAKKHAEDMAAVEAHAAAQHVLLKRLLSRKAIREALDARGVPPRLQEGAIALLCEDLKIEVDDPSEEGGAPVLVVHDAFGLLSIESAVARWLTSDEGAGFRPKGRNRPGEFGAMIEALKAPR